MKKSFNFAFMQELFLAFVHYAGSVALTIFECVFFVNNSPSGWLQSVFFLMAIVFSLGSVSLWDSWCYDKNRWWALLLSILACLFIIVPVANISISGLSNYSVAQVAKTDADTLVELGKAQAQAVSKAVEKNSTAASTVKGWAASELATASVKQTEASQKAFESAYSATKDAIALKQQVTTAKTEKAQDFSGFESIAQALGHPEWTLMFLFIFYLGRAAIFQVIVFATTPKQELLLELRGEEPKKEEEPIEEEREELTPEEPVDVQESPEKVPQRVLQPLTREGMELWVQLCWEYATSYGKIPSDDDLQRIVEGRYGSKRPPFYKRYYAQVLRRAVALRLVDAEGQVLVPDTQEALDIMFARKLPRA